MSMEYRDYLPEGVTTGPGREYIAPEPGTGTVYVGPPDYEGVWKVSWQGPGSRFSSAWGSEEAVVAWAFAQPASRRLICREAGRDELIWVDLKETSEDDDHDGDATG